MSERTNEQVAEIMANWWGERLNNQHANQRKAFVECLRGKIVAALHEQKGKRFLRLENDYDPQDLLLEAVRETVDPQCRGFLCSGDGIFPRKHELTLSGDVIEPKEGYGNWTEPL